MIRYEANLDGTTSVGEPFTNFDELKVLEEIFNKLNWKYTRIRTGKAGYYFFEIEFSENIKSKIHIYLKRITFGGREGRPYEKRTQFSAAIERSGFSNLNEDNDDEFSLILGIYKNDNYSDEIICAWDVHDWGHNIGRAFNCYIDIKAIAKALKNGFAQYKSSKGQIACCFREKEFLYYLNNRKSLHKKLKSNSEENKINYLLDKDNSYVDEIPNYSYLFQTTIDILKNHNGIANIDTIEIEAGNILNLTGFSKYKIHNPNEGNRTELGYQLAWARFYLKKAGLIISPKRSIWELTEQGWNVIEIDRELIINLATQKEIQSEIDKETLFNIESEDDIEIENELSNYNSEEIENPFNPNDVDIRTRTMSLDLLIKRLKNDAINLDTSFQRKANLWNKTKQSRLIESILVRFPLPAFYFDGSNDDNWLVVDGLQRLSSLNNYVNLEVFALENLEFLTQFNGKKFNELPTSLQRRIEEFEITAYVIAAGTPKILKFNVFKRINTGGLTLTSQEIRNALYQGEATFLVKRLADLRSFKIATNYSISEDRMLDQEFISRFLAFYLFGTESYYSDLDSFLNKSMEAINSTLDTELIKNIENDFNNAMTASMLIFDKHAFRKRFSLDDKRKPINKALFEVWAVLLSKKTPFELNILINQKNTIIEKFINLLNNDENFNKAITSGTGDKSRVKKRFNEIQNIIDTIIKEKTYD